MIVENLDLGYSDFNPARALSHSATPPKPPISDAYFANAVSTAVSYYFCTTVKGFPRLLELFAYREVPAHERDPGFE